MSTRKRSAPIRRRRGTDSILRAIPPPFRGRTRLAGLRVTSIVASDSDIEPRWRNEVPASWSTIDCDVHINVPSMQALLPHLDEYWRDSVVDRGLNSLESISYPPKAPLTARP